MVSQAQMVGLAVFDIDGMGSGPGSLLKSKLYYGKPKIYNFIDL